MRLTYHPGAEADVLDALRYYQGRREGLGDRFLKEFDASIATILQAPDRWRVVEGEIRRFLMRNFPYGIYYRATEDELRILVLKHHSRHPDYGRDRFG